MMVIVALRESLWRGHYDYQQTCGYESADHHDDLQ
jgi:hypothetical protein